MAHLEKLFELQKEEFRNRAEMYRTKMTKMFTGIIEGKSFEERIHEFWDDWSIPHRIEFLNVAFSKFVFLISLSLFILFYFSLFLFLLSRYLFYFILFSSSPKI